jgi:SAM-dependent methyltransferase
MSGPVASRICRHPTRQPLYGGLLLRCDDCQLVFTAQEPSVDYTQSYFACDHEAGYDFSSEFARDLDSARFGAELDRLERMGLLGSVLDVGCATGSFLALAAARGWEIAGVEASSFAREQASARLGLCVPSSLADLDPGRRFDVVTLHHVLEHVMDPIAFLSEEVAPRVGRLLLLEVPNFESLAARASGRSWRHLRPDQHVHHFSRATLAGSVEQVGMELIRSYTLWEVPWSLRAALFTLQQLPGLLRPASLESEAISGMRTGAADVSAYHSPRGLRRALGVASRWAFHPMIRMLERAGLGERLVVEARPKRRS